MTRPMPGPPEPVPHEFYALPHKLTDDPWPYCSGCAAENRIRLADPKRLSDAACAAHYWQAFCYRARALAEIINLPPHEARRIVKESDTWHRFDTHHHALEKS